MINPFFQKKGPFTIDKILSSIKAENNFENLNIEIFDIKDLVSASTNEITFFHSKKYESVASTTKASYCLTTNKLSNILPKNCKPIEVDNVLVSTAMITSMFYPDAITDDFDVHATNIEKTSFNNTVNHGQNILIGTNVKIGANCSIGHNSIIESNVIIGDNCSIGSNVIIRNTLIKNNVSILDGCVIGKKGFGFFPNKERNIRYPHIGVVIIEDNCEVGCGSTIDRGSLSNTIIGKNTYIDNQVHIAHNNKIGQNCIIAGQVGFAGSSTLGNNVMIGGQAGISGHLKVGSNVQIGGGSGVIKDIPDNSKVMGYPAKDLKKFIKENK
ncbi:UDP-3-O-(3-hydroxymyristoyl)glucosamine N-acyltransferase [Candidatus Pelagibacter communis]|uniref:UDP-3-O-(3-hydroxymyristoyl)glucosamine N-acyltransferase n=1 Tax=Pelagibacter ubique TaxID=198252 RepID=UPI00092CECD8|nr:UDP-3-O-(3-hydroxymyristoyl)glucosamine N-acyltransferase [Candidatus Pelagibacter ubique]